MASKAHESELERQSRCNYTPLVNSNSLKAMEISSSPTTMSEMCSLSPKYHIQSIFSHPDCRSTPSVALPRSCCSTRHLSSAQCSTLHADQIAVSVLPTCSGISASEVMMQSDASVLSSETGTSSIISYPGLICMEGEKLELESPTRNCLFHSASSLLCLDLEKPQAVLHSSSPLIGDLTQQTGWHSQLPCPLPYLQVYDRQWSCPSINTSSVLFPGNAEQSQGIGHSSADCLFSYSDVLEQISGVDGHIFPSRLQNVLSSNGDMLPSCATSQELQETSIKLPTTPMGGNTGYSFSSDGHIVGSVEHFNGNVKHCNGSAVEMTVGFPSPADYRGRSSQTLSWQSPSSITSQNNSLEIHYMNSSIIDEDSEQLFHLDTPDRSLKRGYTSDIEDDMNRCTKKSITCSSLSSSCHTLQSKPAKANLRAKKRSATDPQSVAARHRRERISERLKNLQDLIPNGSKVDLVTMLEKAINYVKFLQLQVKVLTTDEYWPVQGDATVSNIDKVQCVLEAFASNRSSAPAEAEGKLSTSDIGKNRDENNENRRRPQRK